MTTARTKLVAFALLVCMTAVAGGTLFAAGRDVCVTARHECGQDGPAVKCDCCGQARPASDSGIPAEARIELLRSAAIVPLPQPGGAFIAMAFPPSFDHAGPPTPPLLDRPIRFAALLI